MRPIDIPESQPGGSLLADAPQEYPFYEYPTYTFNKKYENDEFQKKVIAIDSGHHLVLAPPGCGKTDILAERVIRAFHQQIPADEMLCLTFTNRAARGMRQRIASRAGVSAGADLFVGNVHRFCSHYLFENQVVPKNTMVIDDQDMFSIIWGLFDSEEKARLTAQEKSYLTDVADMQHLAFQIASNCPKELLLHTDLFTRYPFKHLFHEQNIPFSMENFAKAYRGQFFDEIRKEPSASIHSKALVLLENARAYHDYKSSHYLIDFEDLLTLAYQHASMHAGALKKYSWIQIDEVQDLSPFQFALIDLFTNPSAKSVTLYLGDEQQAIFSFIGAKLSTLEWLRKRCQQNIHRLYHNYRSPKYLLDVFNTYANVQLNVDPEFLPNTDNLTPSTPDSLQLFTAADKEEEVKVVAEMVSKLHAEHPDERIAVLVPWNKDADEISDRLTAQHMHHFKISGTDLFTIPQAQFLFSHLQVVYTESNWMAWSKILTGINLFKQPSDARRFVKKLKDLYLLPSDFLRYNRSSYMLELCKCCEGEYVIFDTETTGLDVYHDDIVQIAAIKLRGREIVGTFNVIMHTDKTIPPMLGEIENPLVEEYARTRPTDRATGLQSFLRFAAGCPLIGHNVEFDYHILDYNLQTTCGDHSLHSRHPLYFDTLKAAHIMAPDLRRYKLKYLLEHFHLEGENSHMADDDIIATKSVLDYFLDLFGSHIKSQINFLVNQSAIAELFRNYYADLYFGTIDRLYQQSSQEPLLVTELEQLYATSQERNWLKPEQKLDYIFQFLRNDVIDTALTPTLLEQLNAHLLDIATYREADLCDSSSLPEQVFVSTVHKAKGLEFENVILFEATDGVYPFFAHKTLEEKQESARLFYVAMTRAKKRLLVTSSNASTGISKKGNPYRIERETSPFLKPILKYFVYTDMR